MADPEFSSHSADSGLPVQAPDLVEQEADDRFDDIVPGRTYGTTRVVGIGGSAGGLAALQDFFGAMPPDNGMAFVVIQHLSPDHESNLAAVLQRVTSMPVLPVAGRVQAEANHVYVISPAQQLSMDEGFLSVGDLPPRTGKHVTVDLFFRTLADSHGAHAVAIVFSGADGDGAIGIKRIKERGGLGIAQDPAEAEHDSMPRAAIATGLVDWVLPAAEIPARLLQYWEAEKRLRLPPENDPSTPSPADQAKADAEKALHDLLTFLRVRTGHDFSYYKRATVLRRIGRRMQVHGVEEMSAYLAFMRTNVGEPVALLHDLLISVTNFFRDRDAFAALETAIPALFAGKGPEDSVRVWVAACATGEEAYSVAMLLREHADTLARPPKLQVFATDLDEDAIRYGRTGSYPEAIAADVSEERLRRFFNKGHGHYQVRRETREIVLFALHDLLKDAPFSRLDLVTCRNLLIYLNREAQTRALGVFNFALRPDGMLFLGSSESADEDSLLFAVVDKKRRLYTRRSTVRASLPAFSEPSTLSLLVRGRLPNEAPRKTEETLPAAGQTPAADTELREGASPAWSHLHDELIKRRVPPSVLINADADILHLSERANRFLQVNAGEPTMNLLRMVNPMLRIELRAALSQVASNGAPVETHDLPVEIDGVLRMVSFRIESSRDLPAGCLLVIFYEREPAAETTRAVDLASGDANAVVHHLEAEIERLRVRLRENLEESEASREEHKAANEELQAMNEELRSASEELETGREELQSINEELSTVNQELKGKVEELGRSNGDLQNLMASTQIATVFLDRDLCIQRYTPPAVTLFNIIPTDVGRPLSDLASRIDYPALVDDAARVLEQLGTAELEVVHRDGRYFLARSLPYRSSEDRILGVVITFVDITRRRRAEEELRASEARFRAVADLVPDLLFSTDPAGLLQWCNQRWLRYTGQTLPQAQGHGWINIVHPEDRAGVRQHFLATIKSGGTYRSEHRLLSADGLTARWFLVRAEPLRDEAGQIVQWFGAKTDIEDFKTASADLAASQERLRLIIENAREFAIFSMDRNARITSWNTGAERLLGYGEPEILGKSADVIFTPEDRAAGKPEEEARGAMANGRATDERWHQRKDGSRFWGSGAMMRMNDRTGEAVGLVKILHDQTEARQAREALERSRESLETALKETEAARADAEAATRAKDHFLAVLSHELRTPLMPVTMAVHLLRRDRSLSQSARDALDMIERNVAIEAHFIDDLLDVTRIIRGKLEIIHEPLDLHQAIRHAVEVTAPEFTLKGQTLDVELKARKHALSGDTTRLQQLFWNLLRNASKFTPQAGAVRIASRNQRGNIVVEVSDNGIGFEPEAVGRIFQAFEQASAEVTREFGGLGLGLAISKATADAHGGKLHAHSAGRGQGATFTVELPLPK